MSAAWRDADRAGSPRLAALAYFALGQEAVDANAAFLRHYYALAGPYAEKLVESALTTPDTIKQAMSAYQEAGCQHLILFTGATNSDQIDRLAEVALS